MSELVKALLETGRDADIAIVDDAHPPLIYGELRARAAGLARRLCAGRSDLAGECVAFLAPPGTDYVEILLGVLLAGGTAVPLSPLHTPPELAHLVGSAAPTRILATEAMASRLDFLGRAVDTYRPSLGSPRWAPTVTAETPGLMLFTSGTTGQPKGVVLSHRALAETCASLHEAWGWRRDDRLLHVLPLHHTHGVIVALLGALWAGARTSFASFDVATVWRRLGEATVFMAVPTIYAKLMEGLRAAPPDQATVWRTGASTLRLATSGSAALSATLHEEFRAATGQRLLERYGMTELGMALSNPLEGERIPGAVGKPLPGVVVDIVADDGHPCAAGEPGELRIRSPQLFSGYHGDPEATARSFDAEGRFRTGDTGVRDEAGVFRLLGRTSVDVLKSGGYKLSALEIEEALRAHPAIADVAVIGLPDETWGDRVTACAVLRPGTRLTIDELRGWAQERLAPYKTPRALLLFPELPRNAMGKVQKSRLKELVERAPGVS